MNIVVFDGALRHKAVSGTNISIYDDQSNVYFNNDVVSVVNMGNSVFGSITGGNLYIKSLITSNLNMTEDATNIYINNTSYGATNIGIPSYVLLNPATNSFKSLINGTSINVRSDTQNLYIDNLSPHQTLVLTGGGDVSVNYTNINTIILSKFAVPTYMFNTLPFSSVTLTTAYQPRLFFTVYSNDVFTTMLSNGTHYTAIHYIGNETVNFLFEMKFQSIYVPNNRTATNAISINNIVQNESIFDQHGDSVMYTANVFRMQKNDYLSFLVKADAAYSESYFGGFPSAIEVLIQQL